MPEAPTNLPARNHNFQSFRTMKIAVTGATGKLGQLVIEELKQRVGAGNIVALVRSPEKAAQLGVEARKFDYNQPAGLPAALAGVDRLLLISGSEVGKRYEQHAAVIDAAKAANVGALVYTSLLKADTSTLVLAGEHLSTESYLKSSGLPYTILRNGWYTENYTESLGGVLQLGTLYGSSGDGKISSAIRADYAAAAAAVLTGDPYSNKTYELAGDEAYTMTDYAAEISKQSGKTIPYVNVPEAAYAQALVGAGLPEGLAQFLAGTHTATANGDLYFTGNDLSTLIGRPTTSLSVAVAAGL